MTASAVPAQNAPGAHCGPSFSLVAIASVHGTARNAHHPHTTPTATSRLRAAVTDSAGPATPTTTTVHAAAKAIAGSGGTKASHGQRAMNTRSRESSQITTAPRATDATDARVRGRDVSDWQPHTARTTTYPPAAIATDPRATTTRSTYQPICTDTKPAPDASRCPADNHSSAITICPNNASAATVQKPRRLDRAPLVTSTAAGTATIAPTRRGAKIATPSDGTNAPYMLTAPPAFDTHFSDGARTHSALSAAIVHADHDIILPDNVESAPARLCTPTADVSIPDCPAPSTHSSTTVRLSWRPKGPIRHLSPGLGDSLALVTSGASRSWSGG
jgi:hypothetical protein